MNPHNYKLIPTLMAFSLIGIIALQGYGLRESYRQEKKEFERDVSQAIMDMNERLEEQAAFISTLNDSTTYELARYKADSALVFIFDSQTMNFPRMKGTSQQPELRAKRRQEALGFYDQLRVEEALGDSNITEMVVLKHLIICDTCTRGKSLNQYFPVDSMLREELAEQGVGIDFGFGLYSQVKEEWEFMLKLEGKEYQLSPKETELLQLLCEKEGEVLTREEALLKIWKEDSYFTAQSMNVYISKLRKYLARDKANELEIVNLHGKGFLLKC